MYLILAAQFESWLHPITILMSLPLTVPFAFVSLLMLRSGLDIFTMLGILVLFGVVKKNSILADRAHQPAALRGLLALRRDHARQPRPVAAHPDDDVRVRRRHAAAADVEGHRRRVQPRDGRSVVGGQLLSLLLTLLATPVAYSLFDDLSVNAGRAVRWLGKALFGWKPRTAAETGADEVMGGGATPDRSGR